MKSMSLTAALLLAGTLTVTSGCLAFAQKADVPETAQPRQDRYIPLPPHQQPREANAPDEGIAPSAKEKALDDRINNICKGC
jgi:hypothetical protein